MVSHWNPWFKNIFLSQYFVPKCLVWIRPKEEAKFLRCQFHQRFFACFFRTIVLFGSFSSYILALAPKFRTKNARVNVDEIDGRLGNTFKEDKNDKCLFWLIWWDKRNLSILRGKETELQEIININSRNSFSDTFLF